MDIDDSRELRIASGQIIGVIMLLLAMLPRDIRNDLIARLHHMSTQEMVDWYQQSTAAGSERAGSSNANLASEGEVPESNPANLAEETSEGELSELFEVEEG